MGGTGMTKEEFKYAMQRGLGRCIVELKNTDDIEKYREIVLWGCSHEFGYDMLFEEERSYYFYQMIQLFKDTMPFLEEVSQCLNENIPSDGMEFFLSVELLNFFYQKGNKIASEKLQECYDKLLQILMEVGEGLENSFVQERHHFEKLCISLIYCRNSVEDKDRAYLDIIEDIGKLIGKNSLFSSVMFECFQSECEKLIGKERVEEIVREAAIYSVHVRNYIQSCEEEIQRKTMKDSSLVHTLPDTAEAIYYALKKEQQAGKWMSMPSLLLRRLQIKGLKQEVQKFVDYYMLEKDEDMKSRMLCFFELEKCAGLLEARQLIKDSKTTSEALREMALRVMGYVKSDMVHDYAIELIRNSSYKEEAISMLATNYRDADHDLLVSEVKSIPVSQKEVKWFRVFQNVMKIFRNKSVKNPPEELLLYMYETTLSTGSRKAYIEEMGEREMLTKEILKECLYDSNAGIRNYAKRKLDM